jgi:hypothetical protein
VVTLGSTAEATLVVTTVKCSKGSYFLLLGKRVLGEQGPKLAPKNTEKKRKKEKEILNLFWVA